MWVEEAPWKRVEVDGMPHNHGVRLAPFTCACWPQVAVHAVTAVRHA